MGIIIALLHIVDIAVPYQLKMVENECIIIMITNHCK